MDTGTRLAVASTFVWLGMVLAISFLEAPLKFRAAGVTLRIGLGIGQLVFRALNVCEYLFAVVIGFALFTHETTVVLNVALCSAVGALLAQTVVLRPLMSRRTAAVLDGGEEEQRTAVHYAYLAVYLALELIKVIALIWTGVLIIGM